MPIAALSCGMTSASGSGRPRAAASASPSITGGKSVPELAKTASTPSSASRESSAAPAVMVRGWAVARSFIRRLLQILIYEILISIYDSGPTGVNPAAGTCHEHTAEQLAAEGLRGPLPLQPRPAR